jgi:LuxR family transcriptional regulator, maltose regulon positive regulatory protein
VTRMDTSFQLLSTKLFVPPPRPTLVARPRLLARLDQGLALPLTLISAPPGFGKTTLISEWRASNAGRDYPLACLSLETDDNDPIRFLTYLVAALGTLEPDLAESALGTLQSPQPPPLQAFLTGLINDLGKISHPFALVLDDYHVISAQEVHEALRFLLEHLPQQMHLVLLSRSDPPLPLARLRARGQLVELRASDLSFTPGEAEMYLNRMMGLALSATDVSALEDRTEGWITGLQLAALSLHGHENPSHLIDTFGGGYRYIVDYLVEEVLNRQSDSLRDFMLQTSILGRLTGPLCDALTGRADGDTTLEYLDAANLFVSPINNDCCWYRYHHLFADVMQNRLRHVYPEQLPELHRRAAEWYEQNGFVSEAIRHALSAGDQLRVARLVESNALPMLMRGDAITVLKWISTVAPLIHEHPWLAIHQSWAFICTGQLDRLEPVLHVAENRIEELEPGHETQEMRYHIAGIRAIAAVRRGEAQAIDLAHQALELMPDGDPAINSVIIFTLGEASWLAGDLAGARRAFAEANRIDRAMGNFLAGVSALSSVAALLTEQGELHRAAETYQAAVQMATRPDGRMMPAAAQGCLGLAGLAYERNDFDTAGSIAQQALELGRRWGNPDALAGAHLMWAWMRLALGDAAAAFGSLCEAEELVNGQVVKLATAFRIDALRVHLWLEQTNLEAVTRWAREQPFGPQDELSYPYQVAYLTLARILIAQNRTEAALALLERLLVQVETLGQMGRALEVLILQSLALADLGDMPGALTVLAKALKLGEPEGYVRIFLDEGAAMAKLLRYAGSHGVSPKYAAKLLSQFDSETGTTPNAQQPLIEPLSERELEVLRLLAEGLSNQEIAGQLVVAVGTIKAHTASLYRKLDVTSRTQAVKRARDLGLL